MGFAHRITSIAGQALHFRKNTLQSFSFKLLKDSDVSVQKHVLLCLISVSWNRRRDPYGDFELNPDAGYKHRFLQRMKDLKQLYRGIPDYEKRMVRAGMQVTSKIDEIFKKKDTIEVRTFSFKRWQYALIFLMLEHLDGKPALSYVPGYEEPQENSRNSSIPGDGNIESLEQDPAAVSPPDRSSDQYLNQQLVEAIQEITKQNP